MRTLLIDNHDSFTHNLFHYLAEVNGEEPEVVVNDDPRWRAQRLAEFDNVVISPGPGNPARPADFGICHDVVRQAAIPLLGICLGHQGIGLFGGADVVRAPEPRHGRPSPVLHDGTGLFAGLPSPFEAVRYHSLAVTGLPDGLEATAWTPDGVLMGLRHRERPLWGVQFHPESIRTQYGHELLRNFARLTREHHPRRGRLRRSAAPEPATAPAAPVATAPARRLKVLTREVPLVRDPEKAYATLFRGNDHAYWLDSSRPGGADGRFSVMGDATGPLARVAEADVWSGTVTVRERAATRIVSGPFLSWIDQDLRATEVELPSLPGGFALGWVGYLGYELKAECGGDLVHRSEEPDAAMVFADRALVVDHLAETTHLLALAEDGDEESARRWLAETAGRLAAAESRPAEPAPRPLAPGGEIRLRHERDAYLRLIDACQEELGAGESYEICLTNQAEWHGDLDVWQSYRTLRRLSPAPFGALLQFGEVSVLSTSPERFVSVSAAGHVESSPIKGTRPRGATPEEDAALVADLRSSEKDRAENLMIVDLVRNDLGRCAVTGSVRADELFQVRSYATVHQLVSTVRARLRPDTGSVACVRAAFPGGSMTGAPKVRTMQIIDRLEGGARGIYSGAIGYFSLSGAADFSIVIRTAVLTPGRVRYGVGGAVVALSDADEEFEETAVKAAPLLALTGSSFPGRVREGAAV
ncbi:aminodeoxychorismate synthase component I [Streptomyces sp. RKAG290]|uniref:aminodeoxychorismate synthase component I n=1 Tax=Streptomyces sp. RKAG290 TaxID=2888348 RepID=UPI002033E885|nr:aminodeoxychorismate synthase component I [Streptomyces sp. RKAG290]MCM2413793.1 aminodeoxychorismate synthase component I [Streptomyces sp. RKAG290]